MVSLSFCLTFRRISVDEIMCCHCRSFVGALVRSCSHGRTTGENSVSKLFGLLLIRKFSNLTRLCAGIGRALLVQLRGLQDFVAGYATNLAASFDFDSVSFAQKPKSEHPPLLRQSRKSVRTPFPHKKGEVIESWTNHYQIAGGKLTSSFVRENLHHPLGIGFELTRCIIIFCVEHVRREARLGEPLPREKKKA